LSGEPGMNKFLEERFSRIKKELDLELLKTAVSGTYSGVPRLTRTDPNASARNNAFTLTESSAALRPILEGQAAA
jgi:hypothetical protein